MSISRQFFERYQRQFSSLAILVGFIVDSVTLVRVDEFLTQLLLVIYLMVAGAGILTTNLHEVGKLKWISAETYLWLLIAIQFSFGGLFGRFLIYYSRSANLFTSWPFLLLLAVLFIGNEFAKKRHAKLTLQVNFFFIALFSYLIFYVPLALGTVSDMIFVVSGLIALGTVLVFLNVLFRITPQKFRESRKRLAISISVVFGILNVLYFTNIIPPLPLALREAGVYHSVAKTKQGYEVAVEQNLDDTLLSRFLKPYETIHLPSNTPLYVYSAVFAPTNFGTDIIHEWQQYDSVQKQWGTVSTIEFPIVGGGDDGYRGYSMKQSISPGLWRVNILTVTGQVIGRVEFNVERVERVPPLQTEHL